MSDNREIQGYADFTHKVFHRLANQIHRHFHVMLEYDLYNDLKVRLPIHSINLPNHLLSELSHSMLGKRRSTSDVFKKPCMCIFICSLSIRTSFNIVSETNEALVIQDGKHRNI